MIFIRTHTHNLLLNTLRLMAYFSIIGLLTSCSNESEYKGFDPAINSSTPDKYFQFFNQHSSLAAGFYQIIVATNGTGSSSAFVLTIEKNNGEKTQIIKDSWSNSFGMSITPWNTCVGDPKNYCLNITLQDATGITITLESQEDNVLYFVNTHNSPTLLKTQNETGVGEKEIISYSSAQIRETTYSQAYYDVTDKNNNRDTLQKYQALHGFNGSDVVHAIFRDTKDLGYGRDMYMRTYNSTDCGGQQVTAFYVRNFKVDIVDGLAYGKVNLEAAINTNLTYHFGSNAIEFSKGFDSLGETCADEPYLRFFTYKSDYSTSGSSHKRIDQVDLDGRGEKAMPQPCISCHGGKARPLDRFNRFVTVNLNDSSNQIGDTKSRLQMFEVDTFQFSEQANQTRSAYEESLRLLNSAVFCTYAGSAGHAACANIGGGQPAQTDNGEWNGDFARDLLTGAYNNQLETVDTPYTKGYVPIGWQPSVINNIPEGADTLFVNVINPNCIVCHGKRGSSLGAEQNINASGKDVDFSSWSKFISHSEEIRRLVFEEGRMPLGLLNFNDFWDDANKPDLLASFIAPQVVNFNQHIDNNRNIIKPGVAVARAGLDRVTKSGAAITLNASSSLFNDQFLWEITVSPTNAVATLSNSLNAITSFSADTIGTYQVKLTVNNTTTHSIDVDTLTILIDDTLSKSPKEITFYTDITNELNNCATQCHSNPITATENFDGIPVWWSSDASQKIVPPSNSSETPALGLYEQVKTRVNLNDLEHSLILRKPSNNHHFGGLRTGFDTSANVGSPLRSTYDLFANWIYEGAVCGGSTTQCPAEK